MPSSCVTRRDGSARLAGGRERHAGRIPVELSKKTTRHAEPVRPQFANGPERSEGAQGKPREASALLTEIEQNRSFASLRMTWHRVRFNNRSRRELPRRAIIAGDVLLGLAAAGNELLAFHVPLNPFLATKSDVAQQAGAGGAMADFNVGDRPPARLHAVEEIPHVIGM